MTLSTTMPTRKYDHRFLNCFMLLIEPDGFNDDTPQKKFKLKYFEFKMKDLKTAFLNSHEEMKILRKIENKMWHAGDFYKSE